MKIGIVGCGVVATARRTRLKVLVEPSDHSPLDPLYTHLLGLVKQGVLGAPFWFNLMP